MVETEVASTRYRTDALDVPANEGRPMMDEESETRWLALQAAVTYGRTNYGLSTTRWKGAGKDEEPWTPTDEAQALVEMAAVFEPYLNLTFRRWTTTMEHTHEVAAKE